LGIRGPIKANDLKFLLECESAWSCACCRVPLFLLRCPLTLRKSTITYQNVPGETILERSNMKGQTTDWGLAYFKQTGKNSGSVQVVLREDFVRVVPCRSPCSWCCQEAAEGSWKRLKESPAVQAICLVATNTEPSMKTWKRTLWPEAHV
jgi:hypothetical protein